VVVVVVVVCDTCAHANGAANPNAMHSIVLFIFPSFYCSYCNLRSLSTGPGGRSYSAVGSTRGRYRKAVPVWGFPHSIGRGKTERGLGLPGSTHERTSRLVGLIILIVVILLLVGAFPTGGYGYGYRSHGILGVVVVIILILYLLGRL
jgi:hypothetical protein